MNSRPSTSNGARPRPCRLGMGKPKSVNQSIPSGPRTSVSVEQLVLAGSQYWCVHEPAPSNGPRTVFSTVPGLPRQATPPYGRASRIDSLRSSDVAPSFTDRPDTTRLAK
jgi:hypothetical protein